MHQHAPLPVSCADAEALLSDALDGGLTVAQQGQLDAHLHGCALCVERMKNAVTLHRALGALGRYEAQEAPAPLPAETVQRLAAETRRRVLQSAEDERRRRTS